MSKEDVKSIIDSERNLKHKLLLAFIYSAGLRASEAVSLKKENIDENKMFMQISYKGKKRKTLLSELALNLFKEYRKKHKMKNYIFENFAGRHLSIRQAQGIFNKAMLKAGIFQKNSIKRLRDAFAVHLLESGADICYLQKFMYIQKRTAVKYLYMAKSSKVKLKSPFDN